ncbi:MAG: hypothetical protein PUH13_10015 [Treponema sp.]|nr:hypothetical protein [Treponema sp.]
MYRKYFTICAALSYGLSLFAQNAQTNDQLELPDVTTVINTENLKVENDALPDFNDVLEVSGESGTVTVVLPDVDNQDTQVDVVTEKSTEEKSVFAEGQIGGGYPFLFEGNFSVFRQTGDNPFKISFNHDSAAGYAGHSLNDGYFDSLTSMDLEKKLTHKNFEWTVDGSYKRIENGLQNKAEDVSSVNQNLISGNTEILWKLPRGNFIGLGLSAKDYIRYANSSSSASLAEWVKQTQVFSLLPVAWYSWKGHGFETGVTADYSLDIYKGALNRGSFTGNFSWENQYVKLYTDVGIVVSNKMNSSFTIPFTVGVSSSIPVKFASRNIVLSVEGGCASERTDIADNEQKFKYAGFDSLAGENSWFYGKLDFVLPVKNAFTSGLNITYKNTAFSNGLYQPIYESTSMTNGLYGYEQKRMQLLHANIDLSYFYKMFSISGNIYGNLFDNIPGEGFLGFAVNASLSDQKGFWGVDGSFDFKLHDTPKLDMNGFVRISPAVKLLLQVEDFLYLVKPGAYRYYGYYASSIVTEPGYSQYLDRNGSVTLAMKFNF